MMNVRILRGLLGVLIGVILAFVIPTYAGVGINLVFFGADIGTSNDWTYRAIGLCALGMAALLVVLAILIFTDFRGIRFRIGERTRLLVTVLVLCLAILHLAAFGGLIPVADPEAKDLLVDNSVGYSLASLVAIGLFALVSSMSANREEPNESSKPDGWGKRSPKVWLTAVVVIALCVAALVVYIFLPPSRDVITSEREARASCEIALKFHLRDFKKENEKWEITTVQFDPSVDRWLCTLTGTDKKNLFIILKPKTGGFEVSG